MRILVVEDDPLVGAALVAALKGHYQVELAIDGQRGLELATQHQFDVILLDVVLPKLNGIHLCQTLRSQQQTPILLLTAKDGHDDRLFGFDAGADDYVVKPFDFDELLARVRALVRRGNLRPDKLSIRTWESIILDSDRKQVCCGKTIVHLTPKEYGLLELFLCHPNQVFSRSSILDRLWDLADCPGEETVSTHIKCLRQKLKKLGSHDPIETVHGRGYRLRSPQTVDLTSKAKQPALRATDRPAIDIPDHPIDRERYHQQIAANIAHIWESSKAKFGEQVTVLDQAAEALTQGPLSPDLKRQAQHQAHRLAGSLGIFGLMEGSQLARQLEQLFQAEDAIEVLQATQIRPLVDQLKRVMASKTAEPAPSHPADQLAPPPAEPPNPTPSNLPRLLIIDRSEQTNVIQQQASHWGLTIEIVHDSSEAAWAIEHRPPTAILFNLSDYRLAPNTGLARLNEIRNQAPSQPILVISDGDLADRLAVAKVGNCSVLDRTALAFGTEASHRNRDLFRAISTLLDRAKAPKRNRLVIVDDDEIILDQLIALLTPLGLDVIGLTGADRLWDLLTTEPPQLLILDLEMPHINGLELCQVIRQDLRWHDLPILFLSAHTEQTLLDQAFDVGADDYISKHTPRQELINRISRRLKRAGLTCATIADRPVPSHP